MSVQEFKAIKFKGDQTEKVVDHLTVESPLQVMVNGSPFSITMRTPGSDRYLTRGLLFTEDVLIKSPNIFKYQVAGIDKNGDVTATNVLINENDLGPGIEKLRSLTSVSSCGICGQQNVEDIQFGGDSISSLYQLDPFQLSAMFTKMRTLQSDFDQTGGCHASAAFTSEGECLVIQEDIGRHNAVDKVIGALLLNKKIDKAMVLLVSGRVSYEIISKAYKAGIPFLASVSAPSNMAVEMSQDLGICLLAFCRDDKATAYSNQHMLKNTSQ